MKNSDFHKNSSSLQLLGKEFIIVIVVIFSAVSFTLGYFVGKDGMDSTQKNLPQAAELAPVQQAQVQDTLPLPGSTPVSDKTAGSGEAAAEHGQQQQKESFVVVEAKQPAPSKNAEPSKEIPKVQAVAKQSVKETNEKPAAKESEVSQQSKNSSDKKEPVYTVQMGAFKSSSETTSFRKKYSKKGIKTFVATTANKKKEKIYKVRTGEFRDRKDAEVLSLKLNKTEDLKTFVTLKNE
jgi:cell division septation protein DedD